MGLQYVTKVVLSLVACQTLVAAYPARDHSSFLHSSQLPLEGRNDVGEEVLEYYGGARGQFLVISPEGRHNIVGSPRPPTGRGEKDEEEDVGVAPDDPDSVAVEQPPASASVAEAKPIAVSIAGQGGTASAQPVASAIVGPGGLALTRPVATAIAGVQGAEQLAPISASSGSMRQSPHRLYYYQPLTFLHPSSPLVTAI